VRENTPLVEIVSQVEKTSLSEALEACNGDRSEAARMLSLDRSSFLEKLQEYGLTS
jgi:two-component system NtrC family response regulator